MSTETKEIRKISLLNDYAFKSLFRSIEAREMVASFLSAITGIEKQLLMEADYQGGELPKKNTGEKAKISDIIVKIKKDNKLVLEMNQFKSNNIFEKNASYIFSILTETMKVKQKNYPQIILINIDNFNAFQTDKPILHFKLRDEEGHIETNQYHSIHLVLENVVNTKYNIDEEIKKMVELLTMSTLEEMKDKFKGDEIYMAAIRKVEDLSKDPNFIGYYDVEEAKRQELEDMYDTGVSKGIEKRTIEVVKAMLLDHLDYSAISKYTNLTMEQIKDIESNL